MKLFIVRHSFAGPNAPASDPALERDRPLTDVGQKMALAVARELRARGKVGDPIPKVIFSSPYQRAKETADIMGGVLGIRATPIDELSPNHPLRDSLLDLVGCKQLQRVMIVGHHDNTTPVMNMLGGSMGKHELPSDDALRGSLDDGRPKGKGDWAPLTMAEVRRISIDRKSGEWAVRDRIRPSDAGLKNIDLAPGQKN